MRLFTMTSSKRRRFNSRPCPAHMTALWKQLREVGVSPCCAGLLQPERRAARISSGRTLPEAAVRWSVRREEPSSHTVPSQIVWAGLQRAGLILEEAGGLPGHFSSPGRNFHIREKKLSWERNFLILLATLFFSITAL